MELKRTKNDPKSFYVVGIGASAGGLEAINQLLSNVPPNPGFAFVIIQHLSPDYKSLMGELLSKHTQMKVIDADDKMQLKPNCVYLMPSKSTLTVKGGRIYLHEKDKAVLPNNSIDLFFTSLAQEYGPNAVGIVLSGTGSDGSKGLEMISANGGIVIVQDPSTAAFSGMPSSAIGTKVANMILPPQSMISELMEYVNDPKAVRSLRLNTEDDEMVLREIIFHIKKGTGQDFSHYKNPTLVRRLSKRMAELNITDLGSYLNVLAKDENETKAIAHDFLINVTNFFRDKEAFDIVKDEVVPSILSEKKTGDTVKVWVVACSTGEEAYSIAILFNEYLEKNNNQDMIIKIFATDVDKEALEIASRGVYPRSIIESMSGQRVAKYFDVEGDNYKVKPMIRKMVVFSHHDVMKDPPFGKMDFVSCRNMLIYINPEMQKEILRKLHFALNLKGYLFVGPSEHVDAIRSSLEEVDKKWRIYRCANKSRQYEHSPFTERNSFVRNYRESKIKNPVHHMGDLFKETLTDDNSYAGILTDLNFDVKNAIGNYKSYLHFPEENFNFNLLKLVHPDLAVPLGSMLRKAAQKGEASITKDISLRMPGGTRIVHIHVKPYLNHNGYTQQFLFIVLKNEPVEEVKNTELQGQTVMPGDPTRVDELEQELKETRESLQAMIEEMEATNEELQSTNEEMVSSNEELQSTNEELQSLNEELHTVSVEHQMKIKELMELNDDLDNYIRNSDIGQLLVDKHLIIRKFTPSITRMVNLIPSDVHRSLLDITTRFKSVDFVGLISQVIQSGMPTEKEITVDENVYLLKINPYERHDKKTDGVVINFIDITRVRELDSILEAIFKSVPSGILAARAVRNEKKEITEFEFIAVNPAGEKNLGMPRSEIVGKKTKMLFPSNHKETTRLYREVVETGQPKSFDFFNEYQNKWSNVALVKFMDGVVSVYTDITEKKVAADLVEKNYAELRKSLKLGRKNGSSS